jgi:hypothetical protein
MRLAPQDDAVTGSCQKSPGFRVQYVRESARRDARRHYLDAHEVMLLED